MMLGEKICLGPLLQADAPLLFSWLNTVEIAHSNGPYRPTDQTRFDQWFGGISHDASRVVFAIRQHGDLRLMGYVQLTNILAAPRSADLGIMIGDPADRGKGFGLEAVRMAVGFGWRDLNLRRIALAVFGDNPSAIHVYAKAGFEHEGVLRRAGYINGAFRDITLMAILRPEH
jgi:RimJ/RimL family protein N-acetyltransferase